MPADVALRNLPESKESESVLIVSPFSEEIAFLREALDRGQWSVVGVESRREARGFLSGNPVSVVVSESRLSDGGWQDVLKDVAALPDAPHLIVTSDLADERLWAEALSRGAYDVLAKPFHRSEIRRIVSLALSSWRQSRGHLRSLPAAIMTAGQLAG
jgi:DNA-binding NtrC family response regulator